MAAVSECEHVDLKNPEHLQRAIKLEFEAVCEEVLRDNFAEISLKIEGEKDFPALTNARLFEADFFEKKCLLRIATNPARTGTLAWMISDLVMLRVLDRYGKN